MSRDGNLAAALEEAGVMERRIFLRMAEANSAKYEDWLRNWAASRPGSKWDVAWQEFVRLQTFENLRGKKK